MQTDLERFANAFESEEDLRNQLYNLFVKTGHQGVQITHSPQEYGKDIVFYSKDAVGSRVERLCSEER
jgi:hypothetical protein